MLEADAFGAAAQAAHQELQTAPEATRKPCVTAATSSTPAPPRPSAAGSRPARTTRACCSCGPGAGTAASSGNWLTARTRIGPCGRIARASRPPISGSGPHRRGSASSRPPAGPCCCSNYGRPDLALDQLIEAAARRTLPPPVAALHAWLQLQSPPDGELSPAHAGQVLQHLEPAFETPPEEFSLYLVRALTHAAIGRWHEARRDLLDGKKRYKSGTWPPTEGSYVDWCRDVGGPPVKFLDATILILWNLPTPTNLRIRLQDELIKGLTGSDDSLRRGIPKDELRLMTGWGHYRLARFWADKDDRANVLKHTRLALALPAPQPGRRHLQGRSCHPSMEQRGRFRRPLRGVRQALSGDASTMRAVPSRPTMTWLHASKPATPRRSPASPSGIRPAWCAWPHS